MKLPLQTPLFGIAVASAGLNGCKHLLASTFSIFGLVYLTDVIGLSPKVAGAVILTSLLLDALADLPFGAVLDGLRAKLKDYGAILIISGGASSICLATFFASAFIFAQAADITWLLVVVIIVFRLAFTVFDLAENGIAARVMTEPRNRSWFASTRKVTASLATLILGASVGWAFEAQANQAQRIATGGLVLAICLLILVILLYQHLRTRDQMGPLFVQTSLRQRLVALRSTRAGWSIALISMCEACGTTLLISGLIYFSKSVFADPTWAGQAIIAFTLSQIVAQPFWLLCTNKIGKRYAFFLSHVLTALCGLALLLCATYDTSLALVLMFLTGLSIGGVSMLRWSIVPDIIDHASTVNGVRVETGIIGLIISAIQIGVGLSAAFLGLGLSVIDYSAARPEMVSGQIGYVICVPFIVLHVISAFLIWNDRQLSPVEIGSPKPIGYQN